MKKLFTVLALLASVTILTCAGCDANVRQTNENDEGAETTEWTIDYRVDEFNNSTNDKYITSSLEEVAVANATTNSTIYARLVIDKRNVGIKLWNGAALTKGVIDVENYTITVSDTNGEKHCLSGTITKGNDQIYVDSEYTEEMLRLLQQKGTIKIYLESPKYTTTAYLFSVETSDFYDLYVTL